MGSPPWLEGLEGPALQLVTSNDRILRVQAGPGTGKTFALMRRVARLLSEGVDPARILVCTFTRTSATDLRRELQKLDVPGVDRVWAGTLHSLCFSILRRAEVLEVTGRYPRPLLDFEKRFLLRDLSDDFSGIKACKEKLEAFEAAWARLQYDEPGPPFDPEDRDFHLALVRWLRFHRAMLIEELVPETLKFVQDNPFSPAVPRFEHVLVDEYQDLNRAEQALLDVLSRNCNLTIVGDANQSIYSFKYAHPEGISAFHETHNGTVDIPFAKCRRCPANIVEMANELIARNITRSSYALVPSSEYEEAEVRVVQWPTHDSEITGVAEFIAQRVATGAVHSGQVLVLVPRRLLGYEVRDQLLRLGLPAQSFFHEEALDGNPFDADHCTAQRQFTLLRLLADPADRVALRCWCGFGSSTGRYGAWKRLRSACEQEACGPEDMLPRLVGDNVHIRYTDDLVAAYQDLQGHLTKLAGLRGPDLLDALFPEGVSWSEPFRNLAAQLDGDDYDARQLLDHILSGITQPELPMDVDYIRIMSLHKSKGLTADLVVVMGCVEGLIPALSGLPQDALERAVEEQRRLFYVAITRARKTLVLSSFVKIPTSLAQRLRVTVRRRAGRYVYTQASRFLFELGRRRLPTVEGPRLLSTGDASSVTFTA